MNRIMLLLLVALMTAAPCFAGDKDPEAAARQARIDRDEAKVKVDEIQKREQAVTEVDGMDAPELRADDADLNAELDEEEEAERRLRDAESK